MFSQRSTEIGAQKLVKQFPLEQNIKNGSNDLTPVGQTGMLINGVEITNYKSNDKIYLSCALVASNTCNWLILEVVK